MDFSDQIALGARLALDQPDVGALERAQVQGRAARRVPGHLGRAGASRPLFAALARPAAATPVTAVGDPNQAIYGWRGASVSNILDFADTFPRADGSDGRPTYPLTVSRRSDRRILEVANLLAAPLYAALGQVRAARRQARGRRRRRPRAACIRDPSTTSSPSWLAAQVRLAADPRQHAWARRSAS